MGIGGNDFIEGVGGNMELNMILLKKGIYGLRKGEYCGRCGGGFVRK